MDNQEMTAAGEANDRVGRTAVFLTIAEHELCQAEKVVKAKREALRTARTDFFDAKIALLKLMGSDLTKPNRFSELVDADARAEAKHRGMKKESHVAAYLEPEYPMGEASDG